MNIKIGQRIYYISHEPGSWAATLPASGRVVNYDEDTIAIYGFSPDHSEGMEEEDYMIAPSESYGMIFLNRKEQKIFFDEKEMRRAYEKRNSKCPKKLELLLPLKIKKN